MNRDEFVKKLFKELRDTAFRATEYPINEDVFQAQAERMADRFLPSDDEPWFDLISLHNGVILKTHPPTACVGAHCTVHNPSDHHMVSWPQVWDAVVSTMLRVCEHGSVHADPDDRNAAHYRRDESCDGCCNPDDPDD